jgi:hypothetical protein
VKTCDHCGTPAKRRYAVRLDRAGTIGMVGSSCAKHFPRANQSDRIRSLQLRASSQRDASEGERFRFGSLSFDIEKALRLAGALPAEKAKPTYGWIFGIRIDKEHAANADLSKPVLFATLVMQDKSLQDYNLLIDGNHRVKKAVDEGKEVLVKVLGIEDTLRVLEEPGRSQQYKLAKKAGRVTAPLKQILAGTGGGKQDKASARPSKSAKPAKDLCLDPDVFLGR